MNARISWKQWVIGGASTLMLTAGLTGVFALSPQTASAQATEQPSVSAPVDQNRPHGPASGDHEEMDALLAEKLGVSVEELQAARYAVGQARLDQALADGSITQEQYDLQQARHALRDYVNRKAITAEVLGMTEDELDTAHEAGQRLPDLLDAAGLDEASFRSAMDAATEAAIEQAVTDGVITAEQAELVKNAPQPERGGPGGQRGGQDGGRGGHGGRGPGGRGQGQPDMAPGQPPAEESTPNG